MARWCYLMLAVLCFVLPTLQVVRHGDRPELLHVDMTEEDGLESFGVRTYTRAKREAPATAGAAAAAAAPKAPSSTNKPDINSIHENSKNITTKVSALGRERDLHPKKIECNERDGQIGGSVRWLFFFFLFYFVRFASFGRESNNYLIASHFWAD